MASRAWAINVGQTIAIGSATITAATDTLTIASHGLADGDLIAFDTLTGGADGPLEEQVTYYVRNVAGDDLQVSGSRGGNPVAFDTDGTAEAYTSVPSYTAEEQRQLGSHHLAHGSSERLGAREGVRPGAGNPVIVTGGQWRARAHTGVVDPGESSTQGPYTYVQELTALEPVAAADGSNARIDGVDIQINDDDADGSGGRGPQLHYVTGTPAGSPVPPQVTERSLRLAEITVPAGDTAGATVTRPAPYTVASGGVLPIRGTSERPTQGLYAGYTTFRMDVGAHEYWTGDAWAWVNPVNTTSVEDNQNANYDFTNTTFGTGFTAGSYVDCVVTFVAPLSGSVEIYYQAAMYVLSQGGTTGNQHCRMCPETRAGSSVGSGTIVQSASNAPALRRNQSMTDNESVSLSASRLLTGLNPGSTYHSRLLHFTTSGTANASSRFLRVSPTV